MKVMFCDICGREMTQHEAGAISRAALTDLAGAEHVCKRCADSAAKIDWREAVGELWREQGKVIALEMELEEKEG